MMHGSPVVKHNSPAVKRRLPSPPKRQNHPSDFQTSTYCSSSKDNGMIKQTTVVELHTHSSIPLPNYTFHSPSAELCSQLEMLHLNWRIVKAEEKNEQHLIASLAQQVRNDSDASFKSSSRTESDSLPFANENAGTIEQRTRCQSSIRGKEGAQSKDKNRPTFCPTSGTCWRI